MKVKMYVHDSQPSCVPSTDIIAILLQSGVFSLNTNVSMPTVNITFTMVTILVYHPRISQFTLKMKYRSSLTLTSVVEIFKTKNVNFMVVL